MRAEAQLRIAELALRNNAALRKKNVVSERQYLEAEAQRDIASAAVAQARVQVKGDEVKIKELKRYAPFAGIMSRPTVAEGAHLIRQARENTGMATITKLDPIQVKAWVPYEVYVDHLQLVPQRRFDARHMPPGSVGCRSAKRQHPPSGTHAHPNGPSAAQFHNLRPA